MHEVKQITCVSANYLVTFIMFFSRLTLVMLSEQLCQTSIRVEYVLIVVKVQLVVLKVL